jgi:hypothetical protein
MYFLVRKVMLSVRKGFAVCKFTILSFGNHWCVIVPLARSVNWDGVGYGVG